MPIDITRGAELFLSNQRFVPRPYITGWNRVEGRVRTEEFERALRAEVRDPLWFLTRQWQFLELKGDDAGSPIEARLATRHTTVNRFAPPSGAMRALPSDTPLEALVECEPIPFDRLTLLQLQRAFDKALAAAGVSDAADRARALAWMRRQYPLAEIDGVDDIEARQLALLADAHLFNGRAFLADVGFQARVNADLAPTEPALATPVASAGEATARMFRALYVQPEPGAEGAWTSSRLEYQFRCAGDAGDGQTVLTGDAYRGGRLDWYGVDVAARGEAPEDGSAESAPPVERTVSFLPAAVSFSGMPSHRFWEMEDQRVEFGTLTTHTTDIGKLLLMEFVLCYGNDWCLIPLEATVGTLVGTLGLVVHDVFGDATLVRPADRGTDEDWRRWAMFELETRDAGDRPDPVLFLPPATPKIMEGAPIERDVFLRDEMANMCWAVERTIPSAAGMGVDGEQHALALRTPAEAPPPAPGATARYRLGTEVPRNWRPFVPVRLPGSARSVRLQRARLPLDSDQPLGAIVGGPGPYFIDEEAVPRAGVIVTRSFQRTRWTDGRVVLWLGRRAAVGRGEGASELMFDAIEEIPQRD